MPGNAVRSCGATPWAGENISMTSPDAPFGLCSPDQKSTASSAQLSPGIPPRCLDQTSHDLDLVDVTGRIDHYRRSRYQAASRDRMQLTPALSENALHDVRRQGHVETVIGSRMEVCELTLDHERLAWAGSYIVPQPERPRSRHGDDTRALLHAVETENDAFQCLAWLTVSRLLV
jgi:hypothetical protein